jgi:ubiquinone biosynthesis monooxygenase Coq7
LERELRSDQAGETGAVFIYKGIIAIVKISNYSVLLNFARDHGLTEAENLQIIELVLANNQ